MLGVVGEQKTKPTQHSVATLRSLGFAPHLLACRSQDPVAPSTREKLVGYCALACHRTAQGADLEVWWLG